MAIEDVDLAALSRLLERALDLRPDERAAWLATLPDEHAHLRPTLHKLLVRAESPESDGFLRTLPKLDRSPTPPSIDRVAGEQIGPYRLLRALGQGGMGTVWLAERADETFKRTVALKLPLIAGQPQMRERLLRERDVLAALEHPNIARLYDAGIDTGGQPYLALEFVEGQAIDVHCRDRRLDTKARVRVFVEAARAVAYAHAHLTLHRDIKPSNILVTADGQPRLLDFGLAKLLEDGGTHATELTRLAGDAMTPAYASPEQILGQPLTVASDVYSLGVVLYELLVGVRPYKLQRDSRGALEDAILAAEPQPPSAMTSESALRKQLAGDLDTIVLKALKKRPADRYATVDAFVEDLEHWLSGRPVSARADSAWYRVRKFIVRNRVAVGAASVVALALMVGAGVAVWQAGVARAQANRAREINRFVLSLFDSANPFGAARSDLRAVDLLKQARSRIEADLAGRPDLQVELLATLGKSLYGLAANQEAQETLQRALDLAALQPNNQLPAAEDAAINLIDLLVIRGEYAAAERLLDDWEARLRARRPGLNFAHLLSDRSLLLINTNRAKQAVPISQQALDLARTLADVPKAELAGLTDGLARAQYHADDNEAALRSARDALALFEASGSEVRNETIRVRALIARILRDLGHLDEAVATLGAELPRVREAFGEHSQEYAVNLAEYAAMQDLRGDLNSAASSVQQALLASRDYGTSERSLYLWERLAGEIAVQQRDLATAREHLKRSLAHAAQWAGKNSALISEMLIWQAQVLDGDLAPIPAALRPLSEDPAKGLATTGAPNLIAGVQCTSGYKALAQGQPAKAIDLFESAAGTFESVARRTFQFLVPWCLTGRGRALLGTGALDQAEGALDQAMHQHQRKAVQATPLHAETLVALAQLHLRRGQNEEALRDAREADSFWKAYRPDSRPAGEASLWLGRALIAHGEDAAGRVEVRRGEALLASTHAPTDRQMARREPVHQ